MNLYQPFMVPQRHEVPESSPSWEGRPRPEGSRRGRRSHRYLLGVVHPLHCKLMIATLACLALSGCGLMKVGPDYARPALPVAAAWQASTSALPHGGTVAGLVDWWRQFDDPLLAELVEAAEKESASLAQARARMASARADAVAAGSADLPSVDLTASARRSALAVVSSLMHQRTRQAAVGASWEIDLFGGVARQKENADASLEATAARWHDARVSVAADTALAYLDYRYLERRVAQADADAASRKESARLSGELGRAGFQSSADVALASGSAAEAASNLTDLRGRRDLQLKALVALSGLDEPSLKNRLAARSGRFPVPASFRVDALPAAVLAQRPDLAAAERDLAAASAAIGQAQALRYPKISLTGNVGPIRLNTDGAALAANTWGFGPSISLPLLDGGRLAAGVESARAQYLAAESAYRQKARDAVKEVEQALVRLQSASDRAGDVRQAADGYRAAFLATEARQRAGLAALLDLEESRRLMLNADIAVAAWEQEQVAAWIALYRAVGGGWTAAQPATSALPSAQDARS